MNKAHPITLLLAGMFIGALLLTLTYKPAPVKVRVNDNDVTCVVELVPRGSMDKHTIKGRLK